jgi:hypothetical protein
VNPRWFAARGIGAFVLKYRLMETPEGDDMGGLAQAADPGGLEAILRPVEAHRYSRGGHGFGMVAQGSPSDRWIDQFHSWITTGIAVPGAEGR